MSSNESILRQLEQDPGNWDLRIRVIENAVRGNDMNEALRLVRESPDDIIPEDEIKVRLHALLTGGPVALGLSESEEVVEKTEPDKEPESEPVKETPKEVRCDEEPEPVRLEPDPVVAEQPKACALDEDADGGLGALIERDDTGPVEADFQVEKPRGRKAAPTVDWNEVRAKWEDYDGDLELVGGALPQAQRRFATLADRISSFSMALLVHLVIFILIGLVVINVPMPNPPQLVVSLPHERESELTVTRITRTTPEVKPSAAAAQPVDVLSSVSPSSFRVPELDDSENFEMSSLVMGLQNFGQGMSFSTNSDAESDVNFFGISGSGKKIVFIIDATPYMLVDEKGGMTAYNNVKEEVSIMLANLKQGTQFNILLYEGKKLVAFRNEMVSSLPSNLRTAIAWMDPLNRSYDQLGLSKQYGPLQTVKDAEELPLRATDVAHHTKAIQKAMEWNASTIFCIISGWRGMGRSPTQEMLEEMKENPPEPGTPGEVNKQDRERWKNAVAETRAWLEKENAARREKGIDPKVVTNFTTLVREITGKTPPRRRGGSPQSNPFELPRITPEDVEEHFKQLVRYGYKEDGRDEPSVHMVLFLGEGQDAGNHEDHFRNLTRQNRGKLKVLRGLAALEDLTGQ